MVISSSARLRRLGAVQIGTLVSRIPKRARFPSMARIFGGERRQNVQYRRSVDSGTSLPDFPILREGTYSLSSTPAWLMHTLAGHHLGSENPSRGTDTNCIQRSDRYYLSLIRQGIVQVQEDHTAFLRPEWWDFLECTPRQKVIQRRV